MMDFLGDICDAVIDPFTLLLTFGHCLTEVLQPGTVRLDWDLSHISGDALVVRRDLFNQAEIQRLLAELKSHARVMASAFDAVDLA